MSKTITAIATGNTLSGIGVIRISGDNAAQIADKVFDCADGSSLISLSGYRAKFGYVKKDGERYDNGVALVFRAPKSYTGEDVVEISVHGGIFIVQKTLEAVLDAGAEPAGAGEFTKRAFLNGKMDLLEAESVAEIISAEGEAAAKASFNALSGSLSNKIEKLITNLSDSSATMAAWIDYPDEEIPELSNENLLSTLTSAYDTVSELIDNYENGTLMTKGIDTAIVGRPNVGKSSLMNILSQSEKSIVTEIEGTTRDIVENTVKVGSLILHLSDTAGIRESDNIIESIGIKKANEMIEKAQLILAVFDSSMELTKEDFDLLQKCKSKKAIAIINKTDLQKRVDTNVINKYINNIVFVSAKDMTGVNDIEQEIKTLFSMNDFDASNPILANKRQKACCQRARDYIKEALDGVNMSVTFDAINVMIDSALDELLSLTGKKATEEVVNNIFEKFCVGK